MDQNADLEAGSRVESAGPQRESVEFTSKDVMKKEWALGGASMLVDGGEGLADLNGNKYGSVACAICNLFFGLVTFALAVSIAIGGRKELNGNAHDRLNAYFDFLDASHLVYWALYYANYGGLGLALALQENPKNIAVPYWINIGLGATAIVAAVLACIFMQKRLVG